MKKPTSRPLTGPQRKFCEGIAAGMSGVDAYQAAYPNSSRSAARASAAELLARPSISKQIAEIRARTEQIAGSAVLTLVEKRSFLARLVRAKAALLPEESDLWQSIKRTKDGVEFRLPDKLRAIDQDNDLSGDGKAAEANEALGQLGQICISAMALRQIQERQRAALAGQVEVIDADSESKEVSKSDKIP